MADNQLFGLLFSGYFSATKNESKNANSRHIRASGLRAEKLAEKAGDTRTFPWVTILYRSAYVCGAGRDLRRL